VTSRKILCVVSLTSFIGLGIALIVGSEVFAGDDPAEAAGEVDADTLAKAGAFVGEYKFVGGQKERDGVTAAIELSLDAVNAVVRNLGRSRLQESNEVPASIEITLDGEVLAIEQAGESYSARLDGVKVKTKNKQGDKVRVLHTLSGDKLTQRIIGDGGERSNRYKLSSDGKRLTLAVEITSDQLPVPVSYSLSYERR
jgi:hypothetical protein